MSFKKFFRTKQKSPCEILSDSTRATRWFYSVFFTSRCDKAFQMKEICPRRPTCTGNHQAADGCRLHGNCTPPRISPSCPHLLRRTTAETASTLDFMAGQEYRPHRRSWPHTEPPCDDSGCFSLAVGKQNADRKSIQGAVWLFHSAGHGAAAKVAFAHRIAYGNVLDEWVWGCQGTLDQLAV